MAAPLFLRGVPLLRLRLHQHRCSAAAILTPRPQSAVPEPSTRNPDEHKSCSSQSTATLGVKDPPKYPRLNDLEYRKWKDKEDEILRDVGPIILLTKDILHSDRYKDGECLTSEDEKAVVEKLLSYHPHSLDKIGCGLDSIMVDRHPQFICSRCLFVVRIDGGWIDFSYQKCLRAYVRLRYPLHADKFIRKHFKR
ncbi:protein DCL homolog, chloroplastic [Rhododendron vialii]|uniref:protein DCL homolog, chloroplastic n=1 Tax=Rhododendron vialii TaxID=182163 RepID=UPI00265F8EF5|nr:protein DCL homolog, chloroplastic [Rhododendron vialii]